MRPDQAAQVCHGGEPAAPAAPTTQAGLVPNTAAGLRPSPVPTALPQGCIAPPAYNPMATPPDSTATAPDRSAAATTVTLSSTPRPTPATVGPFGSSVGDTTPLPPLCEPPVCDVGDAARHHHLQPTGSSCFARYAERGGGGVGEQDPSARAVDGGSGPVSCAGPSSPNSPPAQMPPSTSGDDVGPSARKRARRVQSASEDESEYGGEDSGSDGSYDDDAGSDYGSRRRRPSCRKPRRISVSRRATVAAEAAPLAVAEGSSGGAKRYPCRYCEFTSHLRGTVVAHERTHTREKRYFCSICDYGAGRRWQVTIHERTVRWGPRLCGGQFLLRGVLGGVYVCCLSLNPRRRAVGTAGAFASPCSIHIFLGAALSFWLLAFPAWTAHGRAAVRVLPL